MNKDRKFNIFFITALIEVFVNMQVYLWLYYACYVCLRGSWLKNNKVLYLLLG